MERVSAGEYLEVGSFEKFKLAMISVKGFLSKDFCKRISVKDFLSKDFCKRISVKGFL